MHEVSSQLTKNNQVISFFREQYQRDNKKYFIQPNNVSIIQF